MGTFALTATARASGCGGVRLRGFLGAAETVQHEAHVGEIFPTIAATVAPGVDFALQKSMTRIVAAAKIIVFHNQIEPALKALKRQMLKDGLFQEMKRRAAYEKPSVKRKRKQAAARKKRRKAMRRMQHDSE